MKQYCINNKIYNCELLTENMATGELWYFLRNADDSSDVIKWRKSEMPEEYVPNITTLLKGCLVNKDGQFFVLADDLEVDVNRTSIRYVRDSEGNPISQGNTYVTKDGQVFIPEYYKILKQIEWYVNNFDDATKVEENSVSFVTGKPITDLVFFSRNGYRLPANKDECVQSTISGYYLPSLLNKSYAIDGDEVVLKFDIENGLTDDWVLCDDCDEIFRADEVEEVDGNHVCGNCLDYNYVWSEVEERYIPNDDVCYVGDEAMSYDYRNDNYYCCEECGAWFDLDNEGVESIDGYHLCESCYPDFTDGDGEVIYHDSGYIQNYHPNIEFQFHGNGRKYLGCEWEVQGGGESHQKARYIFGNTKEFYCCHDGSLNEGFEAITHPCTPEYLLSNITWEELVCRLDDKGYYDEDGAGFHIHISRSHFESNSNVGKLVRFFSINYMKLVEFANRSLSDAHQWADATDCSGHTKFIESYEEAREQRYSAVNVQNSETIEIRLFNTSYDAETIRAYIQFADVISDLANGKFYDMTFENVKKIAEERNYTELISYMAEKGLV